MQKEALTMDQATYNSVAIVVLGALLSAGLTFVAAMFWNAKAGRKTKANALRESAEAMKNRVQGLESQLATLTATFTPISAAFQAVLIKQLTHFHEPETDELLQKAEKNTLMPHEMKRLHELLLKRAQDLNGRIDDSEREAALMLPMVMNRVQRGATVTGSEVMVVLVPKDMQK